MKKFLLAALSALLFSACEPAATFDNPQPDKVKSLTAFPAKLTGRYGGIDSGTELFIGDQLVVRRFTGSEKRADGDGDTLEFSVDWTDTLLDLSKGDVLKKFRGYYFLNKPVGDGGWEVIKLWLDQGVLLVGEVSKDEDLPALRVITDSRGETAHFAPSRAQFRKFVTHEGFRHRQRFRKASGN